MRLWLFLIERGSFSFVGVIRAALFNERNHV
jgi:hypothetical protein